jgi:hypothetical protein
MGFSIKAKKSYPCPLISHCAIYMMSFLLNNSKFGDFIDCIYPIELEIKDATYRARVDAYLDINLEIDSEDS